jgi:hypothetical protein
MEQVAALAMFRSARPVRGPRARLHLPAVASGDRSFAAAAVGVSVTLAGNDRSAGRLRMVADPRARPPEALGAPRWAVRRSPHQMSARPSRTWRRVSGGYLQAMSHLKPVWPFRRGRWSPTWARGARRRSPGNATDGRQTARARPPRGRLQETMLARLTGSASPRAASARGSAVPEGR